MSTYRQELARRIGRAETGAAPYIAAVNMQVRTGLSVPFAGYMAARDEAPPPDAEPVRFQVRTGLSVPFADHMRSRAPVGRPAAEPVELQVRTGLSVPFNPYMLGAHAEELLKKRIMISPVVVQWRYRVASPADFTGWLATREILLSEGRISSDAELKGVRYGGTYRLAGDDDRATFKTVWGYTSEAAMQSMHRLCSDDSVTATLVQLELIEFVRGLRTLIAEAGEQHFTEEVMISAAAGQC
ncbi:MAG: hypothetical protein KJZ80_10925 [Hyphomicrobiaceae bacterium]|nr:hypothetical protein [Hyphomicrobiaceae bacterium]